MPVHKRNEWWCVWYSNKDEPCPFKNHSEMIVIKHEESEHKEMRTCKICISGNYKVPFQSKHKNEILEHIKTVHKIEEPRDDPETFTCHYLIGNEECGEMFKYRNLLKRHQKIEGHFKTERTCRYLIKGQNGWEECGFDCDDVKELMEHKVESGHMTNKLSLRNRRKEERAQNNRQRKKIKL